MIPLTIAQCETLGKIASDQTDDVAICLRPHSGWTVAAFFWPPDGPETLALIHPDGCWEWADETSLTSNPASRRRNVGERMEGEA